MVLLNPPLRAPFSPLFLPHQVLQKAHFMPESYSRKQLVITFGQMIQVLDEMVRKNFSEWIQNLDGQYLKRLEQPLMVRCKDKTAKLDINFDKWVTQTEHRRHKAFTLNYTFIHSNSVLHTVLCVLVTHKNLYQYSKLTWHPCSQRRNEYTQLDKEICSYTKYSCRN